MAWVKRWPVDKYVVAMNEFGKYGCSCPAWIYKRKECEHIRSVKVRLVLEGAADQIEQTLTEDRTVQPEKTKKRKYKRKLATEARAVKAAKK